MKGRTINTVAQAELIFADGKNSIEGNFETFPGWLAGKSDFNENPVVSLDLDF